MLIDYVNVQVKCRILFSCAEMPYRNHVLEQNCGDLKIYCLLRKAAICRRNWSCPDDEVDLSVWGFSMDGPRFW